MLICVNKTSALALLRHVRATGELAHAQICGLPEPDPLPQRRWTARLIPHELLGLRDAPSPERRVCVAVPSQETRPLASFFSSTVYSTGLPPGSFLQLSDDLVIPCPELLFIELARVMHPAVHELLGYELCGTFARSPIDPRTGGVTHGLAPVTDVLRIGDYIDQCQGIAGMPAARRHLKNVRDNAWSAIEAVMALMVVRPVRDLGYGIEKITLNKRQGNPRALVQRGCMSSRVPDIVLDDLPVGFNYDGHDHLNLSSIIKSISNSTELGASLAQLRNKYVDDRKRDRELAAQGRVVMPVVAEDVFACGGLDTVVLEALMASERLGGPAAASVVEDGAWDHQVEQARQQLVWSLLPWEGGKSLGAF